MVPNHILIIIFGSKTFLVLSWTFEGSPERTTLEPKMVQVLSVSSFLQYLLLILHNVWAVRSSSFINSNHLYSFFIIHWINPLSCHNKFFHSFLFQYIVLLFHLCSYVLYFYYPISAILFQYLKQKECEKSIKHIVNKKKKKKKKLKKKIKHES